MTDQHELNEHTHTRRDKAFTPQGH